MKEKGRTRFSDFLKRSRKARNLSQYDLARRLGVSQTYIYEFEKGRRGAPPLMHVMRLAHVLDLNKEDSRTLLELAATERPDRPVFDAFLDQDRRVALLEQQLHVAETGARDLERVRIGDHAFDLPKGTEIPSGIAGYLREHPETTITGEQLLVLLSLRGRGGELTPEGIELGIREIREEADAHHMLDAVLGSDDRETILRTLRALAQVTRRDGGR